MQWTENGEGHVGVAICCINHSMRYQRASHFLIKFGSKVYISSVHSLTIAIDIEVFNTVRNLQNVFESAHDSNPISFRNLEFLKTPRQAFLGF